MSVPYEKDDLLEVAHDGDNSTQTDSQVETDPSLSQLQSVPSQIDSSSDVALPLPDSTSSHSPSGPAQACYSPSGRMGYAHEHFFLVSLTSQIERESEMNGERIPFINGAEGSTFYPQEHIIMAKKRKQMLSKAGPSPPPVRILRPGRFVQRLLDMISSVPTDRLIQVMNESRLNFTPAEEANCRYLAHLILTTPDGQEPTREQLRQFLDVATPVLQEQYEASFSDPNSNFPREQWLALRACYDSFIRATSTVSSTEGQSGANTHTCNGCMYPHNNMVNSTENPTSSNASDGDVLPVEPSNSETGEEKNGDGN